MQEKIHQIVYEVAALLEAAATPSEYEAPLPPSTPRSTTSLSSSGPRLNSSCHMAVTGMDPQTTTRPDLSAGFTRTCPSTRPTVTSTGGVFLIGVEAIQAASRGG